MARMTKAEIVEKIISATPDPNDPWGRAKVVPDSRYPGIELIVANGKVEIDDGWMPWFRLYRDELELVSVIGPAADAILAKLGSLDELDEMSRFFAAVMAGQSCPRCGDIRTPKKSFRSGETDRYGDRWESVTVTCLGCGFWARARRSYSSGSLTPRQDEMGYDSSAGFTSWAVTRT